MTHGFTRYLGMAALAVLLLSTTLAAATPRRVGIVNVTRIIWQMPQFQQYSQQYAAERQRLLGATGGKAAVKRNRAAIQASVKKWEGIRGRFIDASMQKIQAAAATVQKDKHLAFVLLDAPWNPGYPLAQDGAVDVTSDVMFVMHGR